VNANVVAILLIPILLGGMMGASIGSQPGTTTESARPATGEEFGGEITVFMQQHTARANGSIDSGMWLAAFESAESQSRKRALVEQRATTLGVRLDRVEERVGAFSPTKTNRSVRHRAKRARITADVAALRTAISDAKTAAAREGVNASRLDRLANRATSLSVPNAGSNTAARTGDRPDWTARTVRTLGERERRGAVSGTVAA